MASPQLAACAPSGAALPLPSSTTSPVPSQDAKASTAAIRQRTPSSTIKQWLSPSRGSPSQASHPLRRVLSPCPQSPKSGAPSPTERRAKRRLETADGASASCESAEKCDCVTELYPEAKRSRGLSAGICCSAQDSREQTDCRVEDNKQASSKQTGKENCSPRPIDWLSVMGQKMRKDQGSPRSPRSPRSPSVSKKQEGKTPASPVSFISISASLTCLTVWRCLRSTLLSKMTAGQVSLLKAGRLRRTPRNWFDSGPGRISCIPVCLLSTI